MCSLLTFILLICSLNFVHSRDHDDEMTPRIAIIGAGMSGTSAAYFLRQLFGARTQIDVYEALKVGGRAAVTELNGNEYEAGASVIHNKNKYLVEFAKRFNKFDDRRQHSVSGSLGLCADSGIIFQTSDWQAVSLVKLLWRYGLNLYTLRKWTEGVFNKFDRIYNFQEKGMAFTTVDELLRSMSDDILNMTRSSLQNVMSAAGFSQQFIDELGMAAMRNNYGQTTEVHGFVGAVSLVGAEPGLWSVRGGNKEIAVSLLKESKASLITAQVNSITLAQDIHGTGTTSYEVEYQTVHSDDKSETNSREYEIVILAAPLFGSKNRISFVDFPNPVASFSQDYHKLFAMFVQGQINATTFNLNNKNDFPSDLMTVSPNLFFNSIGEQSPVTSDSETASKIDHSVWKTFLNEAPTEEQISRLFDSRSDLKFVEWLAYPEYKPNIDMPPFILNEKLYYINAIESAASAMEMSVIGARNIALLAFNQWHGHFDKIDEMVLPVDEADRSDL